MTIGEWRAEFWKALIEYMLNDPLLDKKFMKKYYKWGKRKK